MTAHTDAAWPVLAFRPDQRTRGLVKPFARIRSRKFCSTSAPPMHRNQSSIPLRTSAGNSLVRTISAKIVRPHSEFGSFVGPHLRGGLFRTLRLGETKLRETHRVAAKCSSSYAVLADPSSEPVQPKPSVPWRHQTTIGEFLRPHLRGANSSKGMTLVVAVRAMAREKSFSTTLKDFGIIDLAHPTLVLDTTLKFLILSMFGAIGASFSAYTTRWS